MSDLLRRYFNIAFLMGKPQDLPAGASQLQLGLALAFVSYVVALLCGAYPLGRAVFHAALDIGVTAAVLYIALQVTGRGGRFEQAFGGYCGASMFVNLAAIPLFLSRGDTTLDDSAVASVGLADFVLLVWSLSLLALIIRHTFEVRMAASVAISLAFVILLWELLGAFLPAETATEIGAVGASSWRVTERVTELQLTASVRLSTSYVPSEALSGVG